MIHEAKSSDETSNAVMRPEYYSRGTHPIELYELPSWLLVMIFSLLRGQIVSAAAACLVSSLLVLASHQAAFLVLCAHLVAVLMLPRAGLVVALAAGLRRFGSTTSDPDSALHSLLQGVVH